MGNPIVGGILAFLGGAVISAVNYGINLTILKKNPALLASLGIVRQLLNVGYLVLVFFLSKRLPWELLPLLIGAAVGLTVPSFLLSMRLARKNESLSSQQSKPSSEKGADLDE